MNRRRIEFCAIVILPFLLSVELISIRHKSELMKVTEREKEGFRSSKYAELASLFGNESLLLSLFVVKTAAAWFGHSVYIHRWSSSWTDRNPSLETEIMKLIGRVNAVCNNPCCVCVCVLRARRYVLLGPSPKVRGRLTPCITTGTTERKITCQ